MITYWLYCGRCGWQTLKNDVPYEGKIWCCYAPLMCRLEFSQKDWMQFGAELKSNKLRCRDLEHLVQTARLR